MGLIYSHKESDDSVIAVWEITESIDELLKSVRLDEDETKTLATFLHSKRKKEWLATRCLLQHLPVYINETIRYNKDGKPFLSNKANISISHSSGYVALIVHEKALVGIDIQTPKTNIKKGSQLFMSPAEQKELGELNSFDKLHIYWCAKEALYKYAGIKELNLYSDLTIDNFSFEIKGKITGQIKKSNLKIKLNYFYNKFYYLVYTSS